MTGTTMFAIVLAVLLVASGSGVKFSFLAFLFTVLAGIAFNVGGGMTRPSGSYVLFFAVLVAILGLVVKVVLWEPAELLLSDALTTMAAYTGGMFSLLIAVYISRRFARKEGFLQEVCSTNDMRLASIGCAVVGIALPLLANAFESTGNGFLVLIATGSRQINHFIPLGIILGTTYEIKSSGGTRSVNFWVWAGALWLVGVGVFLQFSKEALFTPTLCWIISAAAQRYRLRLGQMVGMAAFAVFAFVFIVPYCQYGRIFRGVDDTSLSHQIDVAIPLLLDLSDVREKDRLENVSVDRSDNGFYFFSKPTGLFDRLTMFGIDDRLVALTDQKGTYGLAPIVLYIESIVPRFIWKNKPYVIIGNTFAHEIGYNEDDTTTGISFSPVAEAYHEAAWTGIFLVLPFTWIALFLIMDSLCGDVRKSPWGLLVIAMFAHEAPEGLLQGTFYVMTYGALIVVVGAFASAYLMPVLAHFVSPKKTILAAPTHVVGRAAFSNGRPIVGQE